MGIFNRAIPNIQTNHLNQVEAVPSEEYYIDDIFDPLFNAKVKEQLRAKYGNALLGTIGGYMEGVDNALFGQGEQWGVLGPGMGILSGFGRSMDKSGDFIIGGLTEGVKGITGQGFENPLHNIFVEDEDYSGTRLLAAMGNSMAGLAQSPKLDESDFTGMWNIPAMGAELMTDPGILGMGLMKAGQSSKLANSVANQKANSTLSEIGSLLNEYDDFMAKVSLDLTAPGLRTGAKSLLNKIHQKLGNSSSKGYANRAFDRTVDPEIRVQDKNNIVNDSQTTALLEMSDEVTAVKDILEANSGAVPEPRNKHFSDLVAEARKHDHDLIKRAYLQNVTDKIPLEERYAAEYTSRLDNLRKSALYDDRASARSDTAALYFASLEGLLNIYSPSLMPAIPKDIADINASNYDRIVVATQKINKMSKDELSSIGIEPEYAEQISLEGYTPEEIAAGAFYEFVPKDSVRNAVLAYAGVDYNKVRGLQLPTPVTFSPSDYVGRSDKTFSEGVELAELMLHHAFEDTGIPLSSFTTPAQLKEVLANPSNEFASLFETAFPNAAHRERILNSLSELLFPEQMPDSFSRGAISYLNKFNDFSNELIAYNKLRTGTYTPLFQELVTQSEETGIPILDLLEQTKANMSFTDWAIMQRRPSDYVDDITVLENLYDISEDPSILSQLMRGYDLAKQRSTLQTLSPEDASALALVDAAPLNNISNIPVIVNDLIEYDNLWKGVLNEYDLATNPVQSSLAHNLLDMADAYQKDVHSVIKNRAEYGYNPSTLTLEDNVAHGVDVYGNKTYVTNPTTHPQETPLQKRDGTSTVKSKSSKTHRADLRTNFGKRDIGYAGGGDDYQYHRALTNVFRKDSTAFKDATKYVKLRDTTLAKLSKHYQVKLKPEFFFPNMPLNTRIKALDTSELSSTAKLIVDEGDDVVKAFDKEVIPVAQELMKDGVFPWSNPDKYTPFTKDEVKKQRILDNQAKMRKLLGFSKDAHPLAPQFAVLSKHLPTEWYAGRIQFIVPDAKNIDIPSKAVADKPLPSVDELLKFPEFRLFAETFPALVKYFPEAADEISRIAVMPTFYSLPEEAVEKILTEHISNKRHALELKAMNASRKATSVRAPKLSSHSTVADYSHLSISAYVDIQNAKIAGKYRTPIQVPSVRETVSKTLSELSIRPSSKLSSKASLKSTNSSIDTVIKQIQDAPPAEAAATVVDFPSTAEIAEAKLMEDMGIPKELAERQSKPPSSPPPEPSNFAPERSTPSGSPIYPKKFKDLYELIHGAVAANSKASVGDKATLRTDYVKQIFEDAHKLMSRDHITVDDIAKYKRAQIYLNGASVPKEEFIDSLAASGMFQMAFKPGEKSDTVLNALRKNVSEINVAAKANILKTFQTALPNGNAMVGVMWDTSNSNLLNILKKRYKDIRSANLVDIVRLEKGEVTESISKYISSPEYRAIDEFFNKIRQQESTYAQLLGFNYDSPYHVKNVRNMNVESANYLANIVYKDFPMDDLNELSDRIVMELDEFKHLRGSWGTRVYDKRFIGQIEDFETEGIRIFEDDAPRIVQGSFGEGSFTNSKFQLYIDLFDNDNFRVSQYFKTPEDLEKVLYAQLEDGSSSGNLDNLVLAAPRKNASGRIVGFTQYDKTTRVGLQNALNNPDTVLLPAHVFSPLDRVLRKDVKMSNKIYAFINKHLTLPFKLGVLMNPGFLIGNASDAYLKQATTMSHKYDTSVAEELGNAIAATRDVFVLNNKFDAAYRRFLTHIQAEGFAIAPSNQISSLAATDPRIRKMLKQYVNGTLQKGAGKPLIDCALSAEERSVVKLWLMLNSTQAAATFDKGLQDLDILAKAKNSSKYQVSSGPLSRITMGKGEYVSNDPKTWGVFSNPLVRGIMNISESTENVVRSAAILNDFRHKGKSLDWFTEYFTDLEELKLAANIDPESKVLRDALKKRFNLDTSEALNTMHHSNFDYERMSDFTDFVGTYVPFPTFFLRNLGYWLEVLVNHPQYIDHAITVQESLWGSRDTSKDKFVAEAKGRGAIPISVGGQEMSKFFKGIYKPTPLQSMFGAFSLLNNPIEDVYYRLHPALSGGITAATQRGPLQPIAAELIPSEDVKYRPYSTDMYERNVTREDPDFSPAAYTVHRMNPLERTTQTVLRLPDKIRENQVQLSDLSPSIFQPDFGEKYVE